MSKPAPSLELHDRPAAHDYEQPLTERMRTLLRLEFLYQELLYHAEQESPWAARSATSSLLDIVAILSRGDLRSEVLKELDQQIDGLRRFQSQPEVDPSTLRSLVSNLEDSRRQLQAIGNHYLRSVRDNEFLNSIKHRSSIPGGTCEFDLPEFSHWLRQPFARRQSDFSAWLAPVRPVCDAVVELLWLIREIAEPVEMRAPGGMYQQSMHKTGQCKMLRVLLPGSSPLFPEISGGHHRFTIRFLEWSTTEKRAVQTDRDVSFRLSMC